MSKQQYTSSFYIKRQLQAYSSAEIILNNLFKKIKPNSVIDIGCATGIWLAECKKLGAKHILGLDGNWVDQELLVIDRSEFEIINLQHKKIECSSKFDLAICIEVVEHLPKLIGENLVESLTNASDIILFSSAVKNQGGTGHVNEQPQHYWANQFQKYDYVCVDLIRKKIWDNDLVNVIYKQNMLVYMKSEICDKLGFLPQIVTEKYQIDRIHKDLYTLRVNQQNKGLIKAAFQKLKSIVKGYINE